MASQPRVGRHLIYGLLDPRDLALRYVGKTHMRREHRLARHIERATLFRAMAPIPRSAPVVGDRDDGHLTVRFHSVHEVV